MMDKRMQSTEEPEQLNGGRFCDWQCPADPIIDSVTYAGVKAVEGAGRLWKGIKSIF